MQRSTTKLRRRAALPMRQRGFVGMAVRIVLLALVLLGLLLIPRLWRHNEDVKIARVDAAERAADRMATASTQLPPAPNDPDRLGFTYGWYVADANRLMASCWGAPPSGGRPTSVDCDPKGDTSCRTQLPVLCVRQVDGAQSLELATSKGVAGFTLTSADDATARCVADLGPQWQVARHGTGTLHGVRQTGMSVDTHRRAWVSVIGGRANCWDR